MLRHSYLIIGLLLIFVSIAITVGCAIQMKKADVATKESVNETNEKLEDRPLHTAEKPDLKVLFKDVNGDVQLIRGDERIRVTEQMETPLEPEDRVITGKNTTVSMFFHDETSVYFEPESELKLLHWSREETYDHIAIQNVSGKLVNDVKTGDKYIVHFEDDYIEVKGTMFLTGIENRFSTLMVMEGIVKWVQQNSDSNDSDDDFFENIPMFFSVERNRENNNFNINYVDFKSMIENVNLQTIKVMIRSMIDTRDSLESSNELSVIDAIKLNDLLEIARNNNLLSDDEIAEIEEIEEKYKDILEFARNFKFDDSPLANILKNIQDNVLGINSAKEDQEVLTSLIRNFYNQIAKIEEQYDYFKEQKLAYYKQEMEGRNDDLNRALNKQEEIEEKKRQLQEEVERERQRLQEEKQQRQQEALDRMKREREEELNSRTPPNVDERERPSPEDRLLRFMWEPIINHTASIGDTLKIPLNVNPDDAELTIRSSDLNIASAKIINKVIHIEALREGNAVIQLTLEKEGYRTETISFNVNVSISNQLPLGKFLYIPNNQNLQFNDGIIVDLMNNKRNNESKIRVEEILPQFPDTMKRAGKVVNISFDNLTINEPVRLVLPVNQRENVDQLGIFHQEPDGSWRYLPSTITLRGIQAFASDFSTFGVFSARKLTPPSSSEASEEVPRYTEVALEADEGAEIYYTTNGEIPTENSKLYEKPIVIDQNMTIKAIAIANNHLPSDVASFTYTVPKEYPVTFTVTDGEHVIKNAVVTAGESELVTGNDGLVTFFLPNGTYEYVIEAEGYISTTGTIVVENGSINEVITLQREKHEVTLVVTDGNNPIHGAAVTIDGNVETSNVNGIVRFSLPNGLYHYQVEAKGFEAWNDSFLVSDESFEKTITLNRETHQVVIKVSDGKNVIENANVTINGVTKQTNEVGEVIFTLPNGTYEVTIESEGYESYNEAFIVLDEAVNTTIELVLEKHQVRFVLSDGEDPILGAKITINDVTKTTNADGIVIFSLPNGAYDYSIEAIGFEDVVGSLTVNGETEETITLTPQKYEVIFTIKDGATPVSNATVTVAGTFGISDHDGLVKFALPKGTYDYTVVAEGYESIDGEILVENERVNEDVTLEKVKHEVVILVTDGENPINDATVRLNGQAKETDIEGKVSYSLIKGTYDLSVEAFGYKKSESLIEVVGSTVEEITLEMEKHNVTFIVKDAYGVIAGANVTVGELTLESDENGIVYFSLPNGNYNYSIVAEGYEKSTGKLIVVNEDVVKTETLQYKKYKVSLIVTDGVDPIPSATVEIGGVTKTSNADGLVEFLLPSGDHLYTIIAEGFEELSEGVGVFGADTVKTVTLTPEKHQVIITVLDGANPIENIEITLGEFSESTNIDGQVSFYLPNGLYEYLINEEGYEEIYGSIEVIGKDMEKTIHLVKVKHAVTIHVTDGKLPLKGAMVSLAGLSKETDANGQVVYLLPKGNYDYSIEAHGYNTARGSIEITNEPFEKEIVLQLDSEKREVSITLTNGKFPIPEATITINGVTKTTDNEGKVIFHLPSGLHEYTVEALNYDSLTQSFEVGDSNSDLDIILETEFYDVVFTVTLIGLPFTDFELYLEDDFGQTDINGQIIFNFPPGIYRYKVTHEGYEGIEGQVEVIDKDVNVYLELIDFVL